MSAVVQVIFEDVNTARAFMRWLDSSGEQAYFKETESVANFEYDYAHLRILTEGDLCYEDVDEEIPSLLSDESWCR